MKKRLAPVLAWIILFSIGLGMQGCSGNESRGSALNTGFEVTPTTTPFQPLPPGTQPVFDPTQTHETGITPKTSASPPTSPVTATDSGTANTVWIDPLLPANVRDAVVIPGGWVAAERDQANVTIGFGLGHSLADWYFALAAPFPTPQDAVTFADLRAIWEGNPPSHLTQHTIMMSEFTRNALDSHWGPAKSGAIQVQAESNLLDAAWNRDATWAILPFEALEPRWKVLAIDGISPVQKNFNSLDYALRIPISIGGSGGMIEAFLREGAVKPDAMPTTNREETHLTVLAMTGVTALVRATAYTMENIDILYPGAAIRDWLVEADLTHISNEVPFAADCPFPNPVQSGVTFCSDPRYISLLEFVGTDIIELTGDHFHDWGPEAMVYTLEMYKERGWPTYGGGYDLADGKKPITMEHNGNRLAFIGCNGKGGEFASATASSPGSAACDFPYMEAEIQRLVSEGYLPVATFQHHEYYYYEAQPAQIRDFRRLADAGALIVSGSQAHQPQGMEFYNGALLHYGLGNLFFDQYLLGTPMRQGFIDRHIFYENRYISTELLTIWFVDYAQPRPMTAEERSDLLNAIFRASGW